MNSRSNSCRVIWREARLGILPRRLEGHGGAVVVAANDAAPTQRRIPMSKLTDTQLIILSAASQRDDRGVELPTNVKGEATRKVVNKLIRAGLLEEVHACGTLPVWRRDDDSGAMALRITETGLAAIDVDDDVTAAPKETSIRPAPAREVEPAAAEALPSRKRIFVAAQTSARKKHHPGKAQTKAGSRRNSRPSRGGPQSSSQRRQAALSRNVTLPSNGKKRARPPASSIFISMTFVALRSRCLPKRVAHSQKSCPSPATACDAHKTSWRNIWPGRASLPKAPSRNSRTSWKQILQNGLQNAKAHSMLSSW